MEQKDSPGKWLAIAPEPDAHEIMVIIHEIAQALRHPPAAWIPWETDGAEPYRIARGASLAHGSSGISLFYAYLSQISNTGTPFADEADRFISHACDALEITPMQSGLYRGLSGIAWTVQHLQGLLYTEALEDQEADPNEEIDRLMLNHRSDPENFDLWEGCIGVGVYALGRFPHPNSKKLLELVVEQLDRLAVRTANGITWFTPPGSLPGRTKLIYPHGFYSLGVAHGISGVISFLSRVHALGILPDFTAKLLDGAISWLLAQRKKNKSPLIFPQFLLPPDNKPLITNTFGWCHGDLGLAAALVSAAGCTGEASWKTTAIEAAYTSIEYLNDLSRTNPLSDSSLCHGTTGLGHLFNRLYQATGVEPFKEEARKWFRQTIKLRNPGSGIAGFSKFGLTEDGEMAELYDPGFIQGTAGIGLSLMAAVTNLEPQWDQVMLISAPGKN